ncbi:ras-related protein Rab-17 isoform X2 [Cuculus canorus]|uniref:ras-related protein Rab-17 isoform X2 n=1 Tax=Cuculus canorus TaxID=55661 RepID=UPI0023AA967F|nr:ras-related protein Rab-17 isoform X2 [Cuculus canorus]
MPATSLEGINPTYIYKVVLLGSTSVGKSSLAYRYVKNDFKESLPTVGCSFFTQTLNLEAATIKLEIWDTAGQEKYHSVCHLYYRGAHAALLVYDIANKETLNRAKLWLRDLEKEFLPDEIVIALVGNKTDLADEREVATEEGEEFARTKGLLFMETSAKSNHQVNNIFMAIAQELLQREQQKTATPSPHAWSTVDLGENRARTRCCKL